MVKDTNLHIPIDSETKSSAESIYSSFGLSLTDAVVMFLRQSIMVKGLPFELRQPSFCENFGTMHEVHQNCSKNANSYYNAETEAAIQEANDIMSGAISTKTFSSLSEFYADLESEDEDEV